MEKTPEIENLENDLEQLSEERFAEASKIISQSIEISPTLKDDVVVCLIKPDAYEFRDAIVRKLENSGLYIVKRTPKEISENFVEKMYPGIPLPILEASKRHLTSGNSEIILVKGDDVVSKLLQVVGMQTNPALCDPETVRYVYGSHVPEELKDGYKYYKNAAHRPKGTTEAAQDLNKFSEL